MAKPTKYSEDKAAQITSLLREGCTRKDATSHSGIDYTKRIDTLLALHTALTARVAALEFDALVATDGPTTEARNGGWVSVEEGLPEDRNELYLIWAASDAIHRIAFPPRKSQTAVTWWDDPQYGFCPVSHWRPLPDAPKP